jgi:hypothetical protein
MSGNTANSVDRAMVSSSSSIGTFDLGYRKVTWGYEESTLSSLFKASSSKLYTVERGITNRYWNEQENGSTATLRSDGRRIGFGAHHNGLHYTSVANPNGFEFGGSVVNSAQGSLTAQSKGLNDLGYYANVVWNNKVSDTEKYAVGINYGRNNYSNWNNTSTPVQANALVEGYNPFVELQYGKWNFLAEYMTTKIGQSQDVNSTGQSVDRTPKGYDVTVAYDIVENLQGVFRYTNLDTDHRGQKISDGEREFTTISGTASDATYNKSEAFYLGVNYFFTLDAIGGKQVTGTNAKIQLGYEIAKFKDPISAGASTNTGVTAQVNAVRLQAQVAF